MFELKSLKFYSVKDNLSRFAAYSHIISHNDDYYVDGKIINFLKNGNIFLVLNIFKSQNVKYKIYKILFDDKIGYIINNFYTEDFIEIK